MILRFLLPHLPYIYLYHFGISEKTNTFVPLAPLHFESEFRHFSILSFLLYAKTTTGVIYLALPDSDCYSLKSYKYLSFRFYCLYSHFDIPKNIFKIMNGKSFPQFT